MNFIHALIIAALSAVPYALIASAYSWFSDGEIKAVFLAVGWLLAIRATFGVIEFTGSIIAWRFHGRELVASSYANWLRDNRFPARYFADDDFTNYLVRIEDDERASPELKALAKEAYRTLGLFEHLGIRLGMRMNEASELGLEIYSPRKSARVVGADA